MQLCDTEPQRFISAWCTGLHNKKTEQDHCLPVQCHSLNILLESVPCSYLLVPIKKKYITSFPKKYIYSHTLFFKHKINTSKRISKMIKDNGQQTLYAHLLRKVYSIRCTIHGFMTNGVALLTHQGFVHCKFSHTAYDKKIKPNVIKLVSYFHGGCLWWVTSWLWPKMVKCHPPLICYGLAIPQPIECVEGQPFNEHTYTLTLRGSDLKLTHCFHLCLMMQIAQTHSLTLGC